MDLLHENLLATHDVNASRQVAQSAAGLHVATNDLTVDAVDVNLCGEDDGLSLADAREGEVAEINLCGSK